MTLKAKRLLLEADVVLFDRLLSPDMLKDLKDAELIDVGKTAGNHKLTQEKINQLLISKAEEGKVVVRLKGGDPYVFGRGGEEALALLEKGIPFEVVPGVTSAIAAPELAGIPVTHRGVTSALTIITGHEEPGKDSPLDWNILAKLNGTLVVLMGVSRLEKNVDALVSGGKPAQTPAAIVEKGGWPEQRLIAGTLEDIAFKAKEAQIEPPAILVVGDVVNLAKKLARKKIAIFRPENQLQESSELARQYGLEPICAPSISLEKRSMPDDLEPRLERAKCIVFTSANGVEIALQNEMIRSGLKDKIIFSIGPKTMRALEKHGISSEVPDEYSSEGLEKLLRNRCDNVLFLRSAQGSQYLSDDLRKAGLIIDDIPLYDVIGSDDPRLDHLIGRASTIDIFAFTSSSTARYLLKRASELGLEKELRKALTRAKVAVIGKPTAAELERLGIRVDVMPEQFTFEALLQSVQQDDFQRSE